MRFKPASGAQPAPQQLIKPDKFALDVDVFCQDYFDEFIESVAAQNLTTPTTILSLIDFACQNGLNACEFPLGLCNPRADFFQRSRPGHTLREFTYRLFLNYGRRQKELGKLLFENAYVFDYKNYCWGLPAPD